MTEYEFSALRPGEANRKCAKCGDGFMPLTRTQKYCPSCGAKPKPKDTSERDRRRAAKRKVERKVDTTTFGLNAALFKELENIQGIENGDREAIETEAIRADKVCSLASNIISNGRLMIQAAQLGIGVAESVNVPKALLGNGDGK